MDFLKVKEILELYWKVDKCNDRTASDCKICPLEPICTGVAEFGEYSDERLAAAVDFLEKWNTNRPKKTRQSEFLKIVPNAIKTEFNVLDICPDFDPSFERPCVGCVCTNDTCNECLKGYWLSEIKED